MEEKDKQIQSIIGYIDMYEEANKKVAELE